MLEVFGCSSETS